MNLINLCVPGPRSSSLSSCRGWRNMSGRCCRSMCFILCLSSLWILVCRLTWWISKLAASSSTDLSLQTNVMLGPDTAAGSPAAACSCLCAIHPSFSHKVVSNSISIHLTIQVKAWLKHAHIWLSSSNQRVFTAVSQFNPIYSSSVYIFFKFSINYNRYAIYLICVYLRSIM